MAIINNHTDPSVNFTNNPVPDNCKPISTVKKTLTGDSVLMSLQLPSATYFVQITMHAMSKQVLPSIVLNYSYTTRPEGYSRETFGGSTVNEVKSERHNVQDNATVTKTVTFTHDGLSAMSIALRGASHGIFNAECKVYKAV
jgi:hypothetical protein